MFANKIPLKNLVQKLKFSRLNLVEGFDYYMLLYRNIMLRDNIFANEQPKENQIKFLIPKWRY